MAKVALYRKYRPQNFDELYGQDHIAKTLKNSIKSGSFSHAYLFCGPRGTGKTSVARILARAINCQNNTDGNPDNKCDICESINTEKTMDIIEIDAASHTQVDNIREVIVERAHFAPTNLKYKVYIIDEAHMLSKSSFNALLKTLEEPPAHAIFILATTEANKILPTIVSRCQRFDFKRINAEDMAKRLEFICENEKIKVEKEAISLIVEIAEGGFRDAISLLDQLSSSKKEITKKDVEELLGLSDRQAVITLAKNLALKETNEALQVIQSQLEAGSDIQLLNKNLLEFLRKVLLLKLSSKSLDTDFDEIVKTFEVSDLIKAIEVLNESQSLFKHSSIPQLGLEVGVVKICMGITQSTEKTENIPQKQKEQTTKTAKQEVVKVPVNASDQVKWQQSLLEIKSRNNSIHAFLKVSEPEFEEEVIKLYFPYKFHKERIEDSKNRQVVEAALSKVTGVNYRIKCLLKPVHNHQVAEPKKDDLLDEALEIFGGEVVE